VARAIAKAAGIKLVNNFEAYKQTNGILPISSVMHTTAGKLRPHIEYVIHTVGPCDVDYSYKNKLLQVLTSIYYKLIKYTSEILRVPTTAVPAISGGIFQVKLESVVKAFYTALKQCTDEYSQTSHTPILQSVNFVNISPQ